MLVCNLAIFDNIVDKLTPKFNAVTSFDKFPSTQNAFFFPFFIYSQYKAQLKYIAI